MGSCWSKAKDTSVHPSREDPYCMSQQSPLYSSRAFDVIGEGELALYRSSFTQRNPYQVKVYGVSPKDTDTSYHNRSSSYTYDTLPTTPGYSRVVGFNVSCSYTTQNKSVM